MGCVWEPVVVAVRLVHSCSCPSPPLPPPPPHTRTCYQRYTTSNSLDFREYAKNVEVGNRSHVVLAFGDFNFRLDPLGADGKSLPTSEQCAAVLKLVDAKEWGELAKYDQLLREQAKRRCFHQFTELNGHPLWAPTFKLNSGPEEEGGSGGGGGVGDGGGGDGGEASASASMYNLKRCPSWCDRVLFKTGHGGHCEALRYVAHHDYAANTSDHVPGDRRHPHSPFRTTQTTRLMRTHGSLSPILALLCTSPIRCLLQSRTRDSPSHALARTRTPHPLQ
jgi:hypothetical protein